MALTQDFPLLSEEEISERLASLRAGDLDGGAATDLVAVGGGAASAPYRYVKSNVEHADSLIEFIENSEGRVMLGLSEIDMLTRGFGPGELIYIAGYTHSGKTQVALTAVVNNRDRRFVLYTMDEPAELVLTKLACMITGSNAERMEERIKSGDETAKAKLRRLANEDFANLIIVDQSMTRSQMTDGIKEAEDYWQEPVDCAMIDYLELFGNAEGMNVEEASQQLKGWAMCQDFPVVAIHQGSRGNSGKGQVLGMNAMKYGGEQEAIMVIGVRRQRDNEDLDDYDRMRHKDTVSVSVIKNKRPPSKRGEYDYFMDPDCGLVLPLGYASEE